MKQIKPEKLFEQEVRAWAFGNGLWLEVYDSKAVFSERKGIYQAAKGLPVGTPDLMGLNKQGRAIHIELKAPGAACMPSLEQRNHLSRVIEYGGFGMVTNDLADLDATYKKWCSIIDEVNKRAFLLSKLPMKVKMDGKVVLLSA